MSKSTSSIEINGRRYDARTGRPVSGAGSSKLTAIDAVVGHKPAKTAVLVAPMPKTVTNTPLSTTKLMDMKAPKRRPRTAAAAASGHSPQTAHTLMRHVVHKPSASLKRQHAAQGHTDALIAKPTVAVAPKKSVSMVPAERLNRAQTVTKSPKINRFAQTISPAATVPTALSHAGQSALQATTHKPLDIFEQALQHATSHTQRPVTHHKHPKRHSFLSKRAVSVSATALSVLLLVGFIGFENRANISLRMAAGKAGFAATMPGYKPSGFSLGRLNYSAGNVALNFRSNSDGRAFAISEKPSAWDSATLRDTFVAAADSNFQTVSVGGRTMYLYGKNNAVWVNGGILYQVNTNGSLSNKQLMQLAASL